MSLPRYLRYKDSGVSWLGEVPEHWEIKRVSHVADLIAGFAFPSEKFEFDPGVGIPLVRGDNVTEGHLRWGDRGRYWSFELEYETRYLLDAGDIVIQMDGSKVGKNWALISQDDLPALLVQRVTRVRVTGASAAFVFALISNDMFAAYVDKAKTDPAVPHITMKNIGDYPIPLPSRSEQESIVRFHAEETGKIDALLQEQQRLIELLKEKRQAVVSHAVTKGLNPDAPLRDSGAGSLGLIPAHWELKRVKYVISTFEQGWSPQCENREAEDGEWAVLKVGCVNSGVFNPAENKALPPDLSPDQWLGIKAGDVLVSRANTRELVGGAAFALSDFPRHLLCDKLYRIRVDGQLCIPAFLAKFLSTPHARAEIELAASGASSSMVNIGQSTIRDMVMPIPPVAEQTQIAERIEEDTTAIGLLMAEAADAIELLQERRTALISAVVTGKIDVRMVTVKRKPYRTGFARQLLAAEILHHCHGDPTMGRVKLQKLIHLCEHVAEIDEIAADYRREAAGPFDNKIMFGLASGLAKQGWFSEVREGGRTVYRPLRGAGGHKKYLAQWESRLPGIHYVLSLLGTAKTQQCEIVSTLYAAWNDLLIEGQSPSDVEIIHEASAPDRWHESKANIAPEKWVAALRWMREKKLIPSGWGRHTKHEVAALAGQSTETQQSGTRQQ